jgi:hypothetical protein
MYEVAALVAANVAVVLQPLTSMAAGGQLFRRRFFFGHSIRGHGVVVEAVWPGCAANVFRRWLHYAAKVGTVAEAGACSCRFGRRIGRRV